MTGKKSGEIWYLGRYFSELQVILENQSQSFVVGSPVRKVPIGRLCNDPDSTRFFDNS